MNVHEPMTVATDYALAAATLAFAILSWRRGARLWAATFLFTAAGSALGGTYHGTADPRWWTPTVYAIGLASCFLLFAATASWTIRSVAVAALVVYVIWMATHDSFAFVIADYGLSLLILLALQVAAWLRERPPSARWLGGSVLVSIVAAVVQQAPVAWHNDAYHVVQLVALWLLYRGGKQLQAERGTA